MPSERVALIHRERRLSYADLDREVGRLARGLRERFDPGAVVALWLPNGPEIVALILACFRTGVVPMPMHQGMKAPEAQAVIDHARPEAMITLDGLSALRASEPLAPQAVASDAPALVLTTSGSNGRPKGAVLTRAAVDHVVRGRVAHTGLGARSVATVASCLTQSVGLYQALAVLAAGGTLVVLDAYDPERMAEALHAHRPTHLIVVPEAMDRLLHHPDVTRASLACLRWASVGADRVTARVQDRFHALTGRLLRVTYGLTESSWALVNPGDRHDKRLALGLPSPGVEVELRDRDGRHVPVGVVGELWVHSPRTMSGYLHDEPRTREVLVDGWLATGDLAWRDADGWYWFAGRQKHLIVLATGDNVSPVEVEDVLVAHPAVSSGVVVGVRTPEGSEEPCAWVTRRDDVTEADLIAWLRARLSDFKVPRRIEFLEELPLGLTGKVRRDGMDGLAAW